MISNKHQIRSMTGFGQAHFSHEQIGLDLVLKSYNSRGLDIIIRLPKELLWLAADFNALARKNMKRGRLEISINDERALRNLSSELVFNEHQAKKLLEQLLDFSKKFPALKPKITLGELAALGDLFEK